MLCCRCHVAADGRAGGGRGTNARSCTHTHGHIKHNGALCCACTATTKTTTATVCDDDGSTTLEKSIKQMNVRARAHSHARRRFVRARNYSYVERVCALAFVHWGYIWFFNDVAAVDDDDDGRNDDGAMMMVVFYRSKSVGGAQYGDGKTLLAVFSVFTKTHTNARTNGRTPTTQSL